MNGRPTLAAVKDILRSAGWVEAWPGTWERGGVRATQPQALRATYSELRRASEERARGPVSPCDGAVWPRFALALLSSSESPVVRHAGSARSAIDGVAALYREWVETGTSPDARRWAEAEAAALVAAEEAEESTLVTGAMWAAAFGAPWATERLAAGAAARAAAGSAARAAAGALDAAAGAEAARAADTGEARAAAWRWQRDLLLRLLREAPVAAAHDGEEE